MLQNLITFYYYDDSADNAAAAADDAAADADDDGDGDCDDNDDDDDDDDDDDAYVIDRTMNVNLRAVFSVSQVCTYNSASFKFKSSYCIFRFYCIINVCIQYL